MNQKECLIGIVPHKRRKTTNLGELDLSDLILEEGVEPKIGIKVRDLTVKDHILIFPNSRMLLTSYSNLKCNVSLIITEPVAIHRKYYTLIWLLKRKFYKILVRYQTLDNKHKNVISLPLSGSWVPENIRFEHSNKTKMISLIASKKTQLKGHKLRHQVVKAVENLPNINIDLLGRGYKAFENKEDGLLTYMFSIVIENAQENDYFTEKLIDCFMCKTIPIYWGDPNIDKYFGTEGMLFFNTTEELINLLANLSQEDYDFRLPFVNLNYKKACGLSNANARIISTLREHI